LLESHLRESGPRHYCATNLPLDSASLFSPIAAAPLPIVGSLCGLSSSLYANLGARSSLDIGARHSDVGGANSPSSICLNHSMLSSPGIFVRRAATNGFDGSTDASLGPDDKSASGFPLHPLRVIRQSLELVVCQTATICELLSQSFSSFTILVQLVRGKFFPETSNWSNRNL
jgi:hypothetical protein